MNRQLRAIIVEDSLPNLQALKKSIEIYTTDVIVVATAMTLKEAERCIQEESPDVVFFDIKIQDQTAFDLLEKLDQSGVINFEIVMVTSFPNSDFYARAFEFAAIDYIVKPIEPEQLQEAVRRVKEREQENRPQASDILHFLKMSEPINCAPDTINVPLVQGGTRLLRNQEVRYITSDNRLTKVFIKVEGQFDTLRSTYAIADFTKLLINNLDFFKFEQGLIVNRYYMHTYQHNMLKITLRNGDVLFASKRGGQAYRRIHL